MLLDEELEQYRRRIVTDTYPMSIGELANLYRDGELGVHSKFPRMFRWNNMQRSRLIESILLGIPLPSICVATNEKGTWDVVDGVQRLSAIFQFMGVLCDENGQRVPLLQCDKGQFLKSLKGVKFDDGADPEKSLTLRQRIDFKRVRIEVKIIKYQGDDRAKNDLLQSLNPHSSVESEQEPQGSLLVSTDQTYDSQGARELLLEEYRTLRAESIQRISSRTQLVSVAVAAGALVAAQRQAPLRVILLAFVFIFGVGLYYVASRADVRKIARHLVTVEDRLNALVCGNSTQDQRCQSQLELMSWSIKIVRRRDSLRRDGGFLGLLKSLLWQ